MQEQVCDVHGHVPSVLHVLVSACCQGEQLYLTGNCCPSCCVCSKSSYNTVTDLVRAEVITAEQQLGPV